MTQRTTIVLLVSAVALLSWITPRDCHTNAWHAQQHWNRFWAMDQLSYAFHDFAEAHGGAVPNTIEDAVAASKVFFNTDQISLDERSNRTLKRAALFHNLQIDLPNCGKITYKWIAILFVPKKTLPVDSAERADCVYWTGEYVQPSGKPGVRRHYLVTIAKARSILPSEVIDAMKAKFDEDVAVAASQSSQ
jgi:hypothetical protein